MAFHAPRLRAGRPTQSGLAGVRAEAGFLRAHGYGPTAQSWTAGQPGGGAELV